VTHRTDDVRGSRWAIGPESSHGAVDLESLTAGTTVSDDMVESVDELGPSTDFNSGIALFSADVVAWDITNAQLLVWAQSRRAPFVAVGPVEGRRYGDGP